RDFFMGISSNKGMRKFHFWVALIYGGITVTAMAIVYNSFKLPSLLQGEDLGWWEPCIETVEHRHLRMRLAMKQNKAFNPVCISVLVTDTVALDPQLLTRLTHYLGHSDGYRCA
ncbi:MAG: hypothetical protein M1527_02255, partial [Gammaproteobacteria bacterium]|nr:hypothetical protein [Gammaproteobacteria bacterium]